MFSDFDELPGRDFLVADDEEDAPLKRPATRGDCVGGPRPCPFVTCKHHLLTDISSDGRLFFNGNADGRTVDAAVDSLERMEETCALDVADGGGCKAEHVAEYLGVHPERVRQNETIALAKIRSSPDVVQLRKVARR